MGLTNSSCEFHSDFETPIEHSDSYLQHDLSVAIGLIVTIFSPYCFRLQKD